MTTGKTIALTRRSFVGKVMSLLFNMLSAAAAAAAAAKSLQLCPTLCNPITSWKIDGETVADFIFWGPKITANGDCNYEIKRHLLLGRKAMTNLDSILKSRDITLPTKAI